MNRWTRKLHRWGALLTFIPLALVIVTGLLLQVKKQVPWVQPPTMRGEAEGVTISWNKILEVAKSSPEAEVETWDDIDRLDVRPSKGLIKLQAKNHWELQVDANNGDLLSATYRRSDWIEALHDGSFFHDAAKLWVFLPNGLVLLGLWFTGMYLWWLPISVKRRKRRQREQKSLDKSPANAS